MSKGTTKNKSAQGCLKISSFFSKKSDPVPVKLPKSSEIITIVDSEDEESESLPNFHCEPDRNKRKCQGHQPGMSPPFKKVAVSYRSSADTEPSLIVPSTSGYTQVQKCIKLSVKTPEKLLTPAALRHYLSPVQNEACLNSKQKGSRENLTPQKEGQSNGQLKATTSKSSSKKSTTPNKVSPNKKRRTPKKLFNSSPNNLNQFKIDVLEKFIKLSPAKRDGEDPDQLIQRKSLKIQVQNEKTPVKNWEALCKPSTSNCSPAARVRTKLNFDSITETIAMASGNVFISPKETEAVPLSQKENLNTSDDCWFLDADMIENIDYSLDLTSSQHCKVLNVSPCPTETIVVIQSTQSNRQALCSLQGFWMYSKLCIGSIVHITAIKMNETWLIDNQNGLLVFEPDFLVSTTTIVNSVFCKRQTVFKERFRGFDPTNKFMIVGSMVHSLLEEVLRNKWFDVKDIEKCALKLLQNGQVTSQLYECGETTASIAEDFLNYIPKVGDFVKTYVQSGKQKVFKKDNWKGSISEIVDIEENIWCPDLGLKGKVDVTIKGSGMMPLEVKTGRASVSLEHRGQVMLYMMMMNKLGYKVSSGLLLYLKEGVVREIPSSPTEKRDLIILRNELVHYLSRTPDVIKTPNGKYLNPGPVPETIDHHGCSKCAYSGICMAYSKYTHEDISSKKSLQQIHHNLEKHITSAHIDYFMHWSSLLSIEMSERNGAKDIRDIYTLKPEDRKSKGKCLIDLQVIKVAEESNGIYLTTFTQNQQQSENFLLSGFLENTYVVVSTKGRPAVATGLISDISMDFVTVSLDRNLQQKFSKEVFFLDFYDSTVFLTYNLASLSLILDTDSPISNRLRSIVIDKQPATFQPKLPKCLAEKARPILKRLNKVQQRAVLKAIAANDYFLIKGMPGTGKTATIVALVQLLIELKKTVLITSHTHSAVDTVCLKLITFGVNFMRLGSEAKIHPKLKRFSEYSFTKDCKTPEALEAVYNSVQVLAVTCLASGHSILSKRTFDVCIVDESTQVLQCSVFRPLHAADTFILIGDPDQLPAVVRNKTAIELGMRESLFERLDSQESCISLNLNYRMNERITALANALTYNGELMVGAERIAKASVNIPKFNQIAKQPWIVQALDKELENAVKFIDTGPVWNLAKSVSWAQSFFQEEHLQSQENRGSCNIFEASVIYHLVRALVFEGEVPPDQIGVIATYRIQVALLSELLKSSKVDVNTVDQFQGKDKDIILYSCSKSKDLSKEWTDNKFDLTEDKRRLNVAITRAKHKLIIVGDLETLKNYSTFKKIKTEMEANVIKLLDCDGFQWDTVLDLKI